MVNRFEISFLLTAIAVCVFGINQIDKIKGDVQPNKKIYEKGPGIGKAENNDMGELYKPNVGEIFDRGLSLFKEKRWELAYASFRLAWRVFNDSKISVQEHSITEFHIVEKVQLTAYKTGRIREAHAACLRLLNHIPLTVEQRARATRSLNSYESKLSLINMNERYQRIANASVEEQTKFAEYVSSLNGYELCHDNLALPAMKTLSENSQLFCRYDSRNRNPLLILSPLKEEILSLSPILIIVYGLTTDSEMDSLKNDASKNIGPPVVNEKYNSLRGYSSKIKIPRSGEDSKFMARIEAAFGLNPYVDGCGSFHVHHYSLFGHYLPHYDMGFGRINATDGDKIATLLLYLNKVEEGGATIFNKLGIRIQAQKGAAVFWFNYHKNETTDGRTLHGACPILKGEKWIATKWYTWRGQLIHRKHGITEHEDFTLEDLSLTPELRVASRQ